MPKFKNYLNGEKLERVELLNRSGKMDSAWWTCNGRGTISSLGEGMKWSIVEKGTTGGRNMEREHSTPPHVLAFVLVLKRHIAHKQALPWLYVDLSWS